MRLLTYLIHRTLRQLAHLMSSLKAEMREMRGIDTKNHPLRLKGFLRFCHKLSVYLMKRGCHYNVKQQEGVQKHKLFDFVWLMLQ